MKKYLLFENNGLLEAMGLFMIGASTKRDDKTKIGRFGSGFKYALAKILRDGLTIRIFSGEDEILIGVHEFPLRDKTFQAITVNGEKTSLTTEMGPDWTWWQIVRELWCNAIDEGGQDIRTIEDDVLIDGREGKTRVFLEVNDDIQQVMNDWNTYFTEDRTDLVMEAGDLKVYRAINGKQAFYRHGILVFQSDKNALFHYELSTFDINEERVITSESGANWLVCTALANNATIEIAEAIIQNAARMATVENNFSWDYCKLNPSWFNAAERFKAIVLDSQSGHYPEIASKPSAGRVNDQLAKKLVDVGVSVMGCTAEGKRREFIERNELSPKEEFLLNDTLKNLQSTLGYEVLYPIQIVDFNRAQTLGMADIEGKRILLSRKLFERGRREIAITIMEENEHIHNEVADETRSFQNLLLNKWLATMEEKSGYFF